jgi:molybdenum cofactor cytidylyltransferase
MISAIILAAGEGKRIGTTKALLNWGNENLINYQINSLSHESITEKIVVVGSESEKVKKAILRNEIKIAENNDYLSGKTSSIKKGISFIGNDQNDILLIAVDQPRTEDLINKVVNFHITNPLDKKISMPYKEGHGGHPIIFSNFFLNDLSKIKEESFGIREIIKYNPESIIRFKTTDVSSNVDINTSEDYELFHNRFFNV